MSGAQLRHQDRWCPVADPCRHPSTAVSTALRSPGTFSEKLALFRWIAGIALRGAGPIPAGTSIAEELTSRSLTGALSDAFLKPWLAGITLDPYLRADAGAVQAYVASFIAGPAALPRGGMAAIPEQLAHALPPACLRLNHPVRAVTADGVTLEDGTFLAATRVIIATDGAAQQHLLAGLGKNPPSGLQPQSDATTPAAEHGMGVSALHIALPAPAPVDRPWLFLPGPTAAPIASISFPSLVAEAYAPAGWHLATVAVLDGGQSESPAHMWPGIQDQLRTLFGASVSQWRLLQHDRIPFALPPQRSADLTGQDYIELNRADSSHASHPSILLCGDCVSRPGIGPALASGHAAAECAIRSL
jgi:hypothetical protein